MCSRHHREQHWRSARGRGGRGCAGPCVSGSAGAGIGDLPGGGGGRGRAGPDVADFQLQQSVGHARHTAGLRLAAGRGPVLGDYFIEWVGNRVVMDLRVVTFSHLQDLSVRFFSQRKTGELISRTLNDSMMIERAVSSVLGDLVKQPSSCWARSATRCSWMPG